MYTRFQIAVVLLATGLVSAYPSPSSAAVLCAKAKRGAPVGALLIRSQCKRRETQVDPAALGLLVAGSPGAPGPRGSDGAPGSPGATGAMGASGAPGVDGQLRIYGDGSAGARMVTSDEAFDDANRQYTDFTVGPGVTLTIPSGTVIRCTGVFANNGTIVVGPGSLGAGRPSATPPSTRRTSRPARALLLAPPRAASSDRQAAFTSEAFRGPG